MYTKLMIKTVLGCTFNPPSSPVKNFISPDPDFPAAKNYKKY